MSKLWDSNDIIIAENATELWCWDYIRTYAKSKNLGYYYRKSILKDGTEVIDYGSHTHFFYIKSEKYSEINGINVHELHSVPHKIKEDEDD